MSKSIIFPMWLILTISLIMSVATMLYSFNWMALMVLSYLNSVVILFGCLIVRQNKVINDEQNEDKDAEEESDDESEAEAIEEQTEEEEPKKETETKSEEPLFD